MSGTHFLLFLIFCPLLLDGQNIIPNGNFEDTIPSFFGTVSAKNWVNPTNGSPDYITPYNSQTWIAPNNFAGYQKANSGLAYMGFIIYTNYTLFTTAKRRREYIQTKLKETLQMDSTYCLQLFVSLADSFRYASRNQLGIYFSNSEVNANTNFELPYTPQIFVSPTKYISEKKKWLKFDFQYKASGGENHLIMGNFNDTTKIDTIFVGGGRKTELAYIGTYYYIDDVYLGHCDSLPVDTPTSIAENNLSSQLTAYPNPVKRQFTLQNNSNKKLSFQLYNTLGSQVKVGIQQSNNNYQFSMGHLPKDIYLLHIIAEDKSSTLKLVKE